MAAIEKSFYGTSSAQKVKSKAVPNTTLLEVLGTAGLLWGFSGSSLATGEIRDDATLLAYINKNSVWFEKPIPFSASLKVKLGAGVAVVYYE